MADRGHLPFATAQSFDAKEALGDLLLGGTGAQAVDSLQHAPRPRALLARQTCVGRHGPAMKVSEEAIDGRKPVEAFQRQGNDRGKGFGVQAEHLQSLIIQQRQERMEAVNALLVSGQDERQGTVLRGRILQHRRR